MCLQRGERATSRWGPGCDLPPKIGADWARSDRLSNDLVLRDGIFDLRSSAGEPEELANRAASPGEGEIPALRRDHAGELPSAHGQEAARLSSHGREVLFGRIASDQRRG